MSEIMDRMFAELRTRFPDTPGKLNCPVCGGKNLHYANCPDAREDQEVYACDSIRAELREERAQ